MIGYYIHTFKCEECLHYGTEHCPFDTTGDSFANLDCFGYKNMTVSSTGTDAKVSIIKEVYTTTNNTEKL